MSGIIEVKYLKGITHEWLCYNFETNRYHLEVPIEYFDDEEKTSEILLKAEAEIAKREAVA